MFFIFDKKMNTVLFFVSEIDRWNRMCERSAKKYNAKPGVPQVLLLARAMHQDVDDGQ